MGDHDIVAHISILWALPFVGLLLAIATVPLIHKHWWEKFYPLVAAVPAVIASSYYLFGPAPLRRWIEGMEEYISFIALLASLYVVSGVNRDQGRPAKRRRWPTASC